MHRSDSKSSAPAAPRAVKTRAPIGLTVVPNQRRRLSDGILVEASILVRLLGIRLLTVGATAVVTPAEATVPSAAPRRSETRTPVRSSAVPPERPGVAGHRLAEAVRSINEGAEILANARRRASR
jgi:hypothetical protein